ncbi:MAG: Asp-tRNA(Asn)/Glu-tRNA(Gln) amidotransferase subunit GatA, partial [Nitrospinaceae bacterium]
MHRATLLEAKRNLKDRKYTSVQLTEAVFGHIDNVESQVGAYVHLARESALTQARAADEKIASGNLKDAPLAGLPIAIKDLICTEDQPTTCSSRYL